MKLKRLLSLAVLCVAGVGSSWADNSAGKATSLPNGVYFFKSVDNTYISRGGNYNTEATLDEFGLAVNITTDNNVSKLLFVDANKPLFSTDKGTVFTDGNTNNENSKWTVTAVDGGYTLYNIATSKYLVPGKDGSYIVAKQGQPPSVWTIETAEQHAAAMTKYKNAKAAQVATAAGIKASTPEEIETAVSTWSIKTMLQFLLSKQRSSSKMAEPVMGI